MGYAHGTKWTYRKLEKEIKEVMRELGVERMPSRSEIERITGKTSLVSAISKFGGFLTVANKMGIRTKGRHNKFRWDDQKIEKGIRSIMKALNIKRMPSRTEVLSVSNNSSLSNKIAKTYGYYGWADKLNLKTKDSETKKSIQIEKETIKMIKSKTNLDSVITKIKAPYDILVDRKVKIEVKYSGGYKDEFYSANLYNGLQKADVLIFICRNKVIGNKNLIIPSHHIQCITQLSTGVKSKYDKYIDRWDYINKFNDFMESI